MNANIDENSIISRICQLREAYTGKRGKALFAKTLGISPSTYNYYEHDRVPPVEILWEICRLTGADIRWLISGESDEETPPSDENLPPALAEKISTLLKKDPRAGGPLMSFIELLEQQADTSSRPSSDNQLAITKSNDDDDSVVENIYQQPAWVPVLGRTAAGMVRFWSETLNQDRNISELPAVTELSELIQRHQSAKHRQVKPSQVISDPSLVEMPSLKAAQVSLVQLTQTDDGVCEFVDCKNIISSYPDAFALRVDGDSMAPHICDADIVVLSPSVLPRDGTTAVVQLHDQVGVTCKIIRREANKVHLIAANENYETKVYNQNKIVWALAVLWRIRFS